MVNGRVESSLTRMSTFLDEPSSSPPEPKAGQTVAKSGLMSGFSRVVQAVESVVSFPKPTSVVGASPSHHDAVEYASVRSSTSQDHRPPSASGVPETPLFNPNTLRRMKELEQAAPLLYPPESASAGRPPSVSSSEIQEEVRKQLADYMAVRDEEGRRLRAQVEALATENSELRTRMQDPVQNRSEISNVGVFESTFPSFGWLGRGLGSLMGSGRAMDLRSQRDQPGGLDLARTSSGFVDFGTASFPQGAGQALPGAAQAHPGVVPMPQGAGQALPGAAQAHPGVVPMPQGAGQVLPGSAQAHTGVVPMPQGAGQVLPGSAQAHPGVVPMPQGAGQALPGSAQAHPGVVPMPQGAGQALPGSAQAHPGVVPMPQGAGQALPGSGPGASRCGPVTARCRPGPARFRSGANRSQYRSLYARPLECDIDRNGTVTGDSNRYRLPQIEPEA